VAAFSVNIFWTLFSINVVLSCSCKTLVCDCTFFDFEKIVVLAVIVLCSSTTGWYLLILLQRWVQVPLLLQYSKLNFPIGFCWNSNFSSFKVTVTICFVFIAVASGKAYYNKSNNYFFIIVD
jgi:hypothetical protein